MLDGANACVDACTRGTTRRRIGVLMWGGIRFLVSPPTKITPGGQCVMLVGVYADACTRGETMGEKRSAQVGAIYVSLSFAPPRARRTACDSCWSTYVRAQEGGKNGRGERGRSGGANIRFLVFPRIDLHNVDLARALLRVGAWVRVRADAAVGGDTELLAGGVRANVVGVLFRHCCIGIWCEGMSGERDQSVGVNV